MDERRRIVHWPAGVPGRVGGHRGFGINIVWRVGTRAHRGSVRPGSICAEHALGWELIAMEEEMPRLVRDSAAVKLGAP